MGIKCEGGGRHVESMSHRQQLLNDGSMSQMNAIKIAHRDGAGRISGLRIGLPATACRQNYRREDAIHNTGAAVRSEP